MNNIAVFAGSFCPFTKGHEDIVARARPLFDKIIVAIGHNARKTDVFSVKDRLDWISGLYKGHEKIEVAAYEGLTVDFCKKNGAKYLLRGVRNASDMINENEIALINRELYPEIETVILLSSPDYRIVSSSFVRELWALGQDCSKYVSYRLPDYK